MPPIPPILRPALLASAAGLALASAAGLALAITANDLLGAVRFVTGESMSPALSPDFASTGRRDLVFFRSWRAGEEGDKGDGGPTGAHGLRRGDVIAFWKPHRPEELSVKRVIGLPGDTVMTRAEAERGRGNALGWGRKAYPWRAAYVPWGHVWVEGDNWRCTVDSNDFGPVSVGLVVARANWIVWPPERWGEVPGLREEAVRTRVVPGRPERPGFLVD